MASNYWRANWSKNEYYCRRSCDINQTVCIMVEQLAALPRYEEYKNSGVEWLGEIPEDWDIKSVKSLLTERKEKNDPIKTDNILSLTIDRGVIPYAEKGASGNKAKEDLTAYKLAYPGDIVLNSMNVIVGSVGLSKYFGAVSPVYYMLHPRRKEDVVAYFDAIFQNEAFQKSLVGLGNGILVKKSESSGKLNTIRMRIPMSKLNMVSIPHPSPTEQTAIAAFLDRKTAQIDQAVEIKKQKVALLKERKQILIQNAVTRGLNPDAPMRDSGVDWIGKIPVHWEIKRLKQFIKNLESGVSVNASESETVQADEIGVLKTSAVYQYKFDGTKNKKVFRSDLKRVSCPVRKGEIIISRMNAPDLVGASGYVSENYNNLFLPDRLWQTVFNNDTEIDPKWLSKVLITIGIRNNIKSFATGSSPSMKNITKGDFLNIQIASPPIEEQTAIVANIKTESAKIDKAIDLQEQQIDKLKDYKTTLINSAVTGKIKVPMPGDAEGFA